MHIARLCDDFHAPENMRPDLSTHITPLSLALSRLNVRQTIYTINSEIGNLDGIDVKIVPQKRPFSFFRSGLVAYDEIKKEKEQPDIIHCHNPRFLGILLRKKELPPTVLTLHDSPKNILRSINLKNMKNTKETLYYYYLSRWASKKVDALICVSPGVRKEVISEWNLPEDKVHTATTAADTKTFHPTKEQKTIDLLFVGRLVAKKRPLDFVRTIGIIKKSRAKISAVMVGANKKDPLYESTISEIRKHGLEKNIKLVGIITQDELRSYYNRSRILILPSTTESAPKVTLESMACGTPVITTDIIGNQNVSIDGKTGYLIEPKMTGKFASKSIELLDDDQLRDKMSKFAIEQVNKNFNWDNTAKKHVEIYESILRQ